MLVIGAAKAGTTSLHHYLDLHPDIAMSREKELNFFSEPKNWRRGVDWYRAHFDAEAPVRGESSVRYTSWPKRPGVPELIKSILPDVRLIYVLRDPVERTLSAWVQRSSMGMEHRPIEEALATLDGNGLVERSQYHSQLQQYLAHFDRSQILIFTLEEMRRERAAVLRRAFEFLGVDPDFRSPGFDRVHHRSEFKRRKGRIGLWIRRIAETRPARIVSPEVRRQIGKVVYRPFSTKIEKPVIRPSTRQRLEDYLRADVARLRETTGLDFPDWSL